MASKPNSVSREPEGSAPGSSGPQMFMPPTARELRAQAVHRLQIGLLGLCLMLLLVGLANIIMDRARLADSATEARPAGSPASPAAKGDPLADIGVVPSPEAHPSSPAATSAPR